VSQAVLSFANEHTKNRIAARVTKIVSKGQENDPSESIDLDRLIDLLIEEYFESKKRNLKSITKHFAKTYDEQKGIFSVSAVRSILKETVEAHSQIEGRSYPRDVCLCRTYLYAITSGKNKFDIDSSDFIVACQKFGLDCPFPFIKLASI
jgi:hypothetical protein